MRGVVRAQALSKRYWLGRKPARSLRDAVAGWLRRRPAQEEFWALRDASFVIERGEVAGIIGPNGAGKSTLLKLLARIVEPTSGRGEIWGRVAALLEVGSGFHPELTGRENIYFNAALMGMSRVEIQARFDEIVAFAEVERFLDTPVKHYSSGMYTRLGFSVAAFLDPDVLIVDEVLAVGDAAFQKKCLGRMAEISSQGRTVLFVSHNMQAIQTLCTRALLVVGGRIVASGAPDVVVSDYLGQLMAGGLTREWLPSAANGPARLRMARLLPRSPDERITVVTPFDVEFEIEVRSELDLAVSVHFRTSHGQTAFASMSPSVRVTPGDHRFSCSVPGNLLNDGPLTLDLYVVRDSSVVLHHEPAVLGALIADAVREGWLGAYPGVVRPRLAWSHERRR